MRRVTSGNSVSVRFSCSATAGGFPNIVVVQPYSALYSDSSMAVASVFSLVEFLVLHWGSSYVLGALSSALSD